MKKVLTFIVTLVVSGVAVGFFFSPQARAISCELNLFSDSAAQNRITSPVDYQNVDQVYVAFPLTPGEAENYQLHWCWVSGSILGGTTSCQSNSLSAQTLPTSFVIGDDGRRYAIAAMTSWSQSALTRWKIAPWVSGDQVRIGGQLCEPEFANSNAGAEIINCSISRTSNQSLGFCTGGFDTEANARSAEYEARTSVGPNQILFQTRRPHPGAVAQRDDGKYYICFQAGSFTDQLVDEYVIGYVNPSNAACIGGFAIGNTIGIASGVGIPITLLLSGSATAGCSALVGQQNQGMRLDYDVFYQGQQVCHTEGEIDFEVISDINQLPDEDTDAGRFRICDQIPEVDPGNIPSDARQQCLDCLGSEDDPVGIWTAVGCIKSDAKSIVAKIMQVGLSIAGGVGILMILGAGFLFSTSQGDPKRTNEAKELLSAAVIGLLFIIFSVTILQFIGVTILQIPDFGGS